MKARLCAAVFMLLGCIPVWSQVLDYRPKSSDEAELVRVENEWVDAAIHRDEAKLQKVFADDLIWNEGDVFRNKAGVLHRYMVVVR